MQRRDTHVQADVGSDAHTDDNAHTNHNAYPVTPLQWQRIKYFKPEEFDSPDLPGSGAAAMDYDFVRLLDRLRHRVHTPLYIVSGYRSQPWNRRPDIGGVPNSAHTIGPGRPHCIASDIYCTSARRRLRIVKVALRLRFHRIGIAPTFIHLDIDPEKPRNVLWLY